MQNREHRRAHYRENSSGFCEAVDGVAPRLVEQKQNSRNQRAGVADTDPPDEVNDRESPADRDVQSPDTDALKQKVGNADQQPLQNQEEDRKPENPANGRRPTQDDSADLVGDRRE